MLEYKWVKITTRMELSPRVAPQIAGYYEQIIHPFHIFQENTLKKPDEGMSSSFGESSLSSQARANFFSKITKFWELQGYTSRFHQPVICNRRLDLFTLYCLVEEEGGYEKCTRDVKWVKIAKRMTFSPSVAHLIAYHYENTLRLFAICEKNDLKLVMYAVCKQCKEKEDKYILLCDGCNNNYLTSCLEHTLLEVPEGHWRCFACIERNFKRNELTSDTEYSLMEFKDKAESFKTQHFATHSNWCDSACPIPEDFIEREYWRILSDTDSKVVVECAAELYSMDHNSSGFPSESTNHVFHDPETSKYVTSPWNLNNLPILKGSLLGYISEEIPSMKLPRMSIGMCFSTACWRTEDHWTYMISYLHCGDTKTWYSVPGTKAPDFERVMRLVAPELFEEEPNLLYQNCTIINPNILMDEGVPVYKINQNAGEFVVTFPKVYSASFNQGYNVAEAVNFAPLDWLAVGRECINHYSLTRRCNIFSQDEMLVNIGHMLNCVDNKTAAVLYNDFIEMVNVEKRDRDAAINWGLRTFQNYEFETLPHNARQCFFCNTLIYLGAVVCGCKPTPDKISCLKHFSDLCEVCLPVQHILRYRWDVSYLTDMCVALGNKALYQSTEQITSDEDLTLRHQ